MGSAITWMGDVDGDASSVELAVGASHSSVAGSDTPPGAVILFSFDSATLTSLQPAKTAVYVNSQGGLDDQTVSPDARFGRALASLADIDSDGRSNHLAVGAPLGWHVTDEEGTGPGVVYILTLGHSRQVRAVTTLPPAVGDSDDPTPQYGSSLAFLGDLDGDGVASHLAIGAPGGGDAAAGNAGFVEIVDLDPHLLRPRASGSILQLATPVAGQKFGMSIARLGALAATSGPPHLLVGDGQHRLHVVQLGLGSGSAVQRQAVTTISNDTAGLPATLQPYDMLGQSLAWLGDVDGDGVAAEVFVSATRDSGAILWLNGDRSVRQVMPLGTGLPGSPAWPLDDPASTFAFSAAMLGPLPGNASRAALAVGITHKDTGGRVQVLTLSVDMAPTAAALESLERAPVLASVEGLALPAAYRSPVTLSGANFSIPSHPLVFPPQQLAAPAVGGSCIIESVADDRLTCLAPTSEAPSKAVWVESPSSASAQRLLKYQTTRAIGPSVEINSENATDSEGSAVWEGSAKAGSGVAWLGNLDADEATFEIAVVSMTAQSFVYFGSVSFDPIAVEFPDKAYLSTSCSPVEGLPGYSGSNYWVVVGCPASTTPSIKLIFTPWGGDEETQVTINGGANSDFGTSLAWLGDLDGDGVPRELAVGAPSAGVVTEGVVYLVLLDGSNAPDLIPLSGAPSSPLASLAAGSKLGNAISTAWDLTGDGEAAEMLVAGKCAATWCIHVTFLQGGGFDGAENVKRGLPATLNIVAIESFAWLGDLDGDGAAREVAVGYSSAIASEGVALLWLDPFGNITSSIKLGADHGFGPLRGSAGTALAWGGNHWDEVTNAGFGLLLIGAPTLQAVGTDATGIDAGGCFMFGYELAERARGPAAWPVVTSVSSTIPAVAPGSIAHVTGSALVTRVPESGPPRRSAVRLDGSVGARVTSANDTHLSFVLPSAGLLPTLSSVEVSAGTALWSSPAAAEVRMQSTVLQGTDLAHPGSFGIASNSIPEHANFGSSVTWIGSISSQSLVEVAVGAPGVNGTVCMVFVASLSTAPDNRGQVMAIQSSSEPTLPWFGQAIASIGDADGDGRAAELAIASEGAVHIATVQDNLALSIGQHVSTGTSDCAKSLAWLRGADPTGQSTVLAIGCAAAGAGTPEAKVHLLKFPRGLPPSTPWMGRTTLYTGLRQTASIPLAWLGDLGMPGAFFLGVGEPDYDKNGRVTFVRAVNIDGVLTQQQSFSLAGSNGTNTFGASIAFLGDLDGDGLAQEVAVGYNQPAGGIEVVWLSANLGTATSRVAFSPSQLLGIDLPRATAVGISIAHSWRADGSLQLVLGMPRHSFGVGGLAIVSIDAAPARNRSAPLPVPLAISPQFLSGAADELLTITGNGFLEEAVTTLEPRLTLVTVGGRSCGVKRLTDTMIQCTAPVVGRKIVNQVNVTVGGVTRVAGHVNYRRATIDTTARQVLQGLPPPGLHGYTANASEADVALGGVGASVTWMGDLDGDSAACEVAIGAPLWVTPNVSAANRGTVFLVALHANGSTSHVLNALGHGQGGVPSYSSWVGCGRSLAWLGDSTGDGNAAELAVGCDSGALFLFQFDKTGAVLSHTPVTLDMFGSFTQLQLTDLGVLASIAAVPSVSSDVGFNWLLVGQPMADNEKGSLSLVLLERGTGDWQPVSLNQFPTFRFPGGFPSVEAIAGSRIGTALAWLGDLGNGTADQRYLAVAAGGPTESKPAAVGSVFICWVEPLARSLSVVAHLVPGQQGVPAFTDIDLFGASLTWMGDLDGDGLASELLIGAPGVPSLGGLVLIWLQQPDGANATTTPVLAVQHLEADNGNLGRYCGWGAASAIVGDLNGDGVAAELLVGTPGLAGVCGDGQVQVVPLIVGIEPSLPAGPPPPPVLTSVVPWIAKRPPMALGGSSIAIDGTGLERPLLPFHDASDHLPLAIELSGHPMRRSNCIRTRLQSWSGAMGCELPPSLDQQRTLTVRFNGINPGGSPGFAVSFVFDSEITSVDEMVWPRHGGATASFGGRNLLPTTSYTDADLTAAGEGVGTLLIGEEDRFECRDVVRSTSGETLVCSSLPAGVGGPHPVRLVIGRAGLKSNTSVSISFEPAVVSGLVPASVLRNGERNLSFVILGSKMGSTADVTRVTIGGNDCYNWTAVNESAVVCHAVGGMFTNHDVALWHGGVRSVGPSDLLQFPPEPQVVGASPRLVPTTGRVNVTCFGLNYPSDPLEIRSVLVGATACRSWALVGAFQLRCEVPAGTGRDLSVTIVNAGGVHSESIGPALDYQSPVVAGVSPPAAFSNSSREYTFTITGEGFGPSAQGQIESISVGGNECPRVTHVSDSVVLCEQVRPKWKDPTDPIRVQVSGQQGVGPGGLVESQDPPEVTGVQPAEIPTAGGEELTVTGTGFGTTAADITSVSVGGKPCALIEHVDSSTLRCRAPAGVGRDLPVAVATVQNGGSAPALLLSYQPPIVEAVQVRFGESDTSEYAFSGSEDETILVFVSNAGSQLAHVASVSLAIGIAWSTECEDLSVYRREGPQIKALACSGVSLAAAPNGGGAMVATVTVANQTSAGSAEPLTLIGAPSVTSASAGAAIPVQGQRLVEVIGYGFGARFADVVNVTLGGAACTIVTHKTSTVLSVDLPSGVGASRPLVVSTLGGLSSSNSFTLDYVPPTLTAVKPAVLFAGAGLEVMTITGDQLGNSAADVDRISLGDDIECTDVQWLNRTCIQCTLDTAGLPTVPEESSLELQVTVGGQAAPSIGPTGDVTVFGRPGLSILTPFADLPTAGTIAANHSKVSLIGRGFGQAAGDVVLVTVAGVPCPEVDWISTSELAVAVPPGVGASRKVAVTTRGGLESQPLYLASRRAEVKRLEPAYSLTGTGFASFNITGLDLGNAAEDLTSIRVGGRLCSGIEWHSPSSVACTRVSREGWDGSSVVVSVGEQVGLPNAFFASVGPPVVDLVSPGVAAAGDDLLIAGSNFGRVPADLLNVTVGGQQCLDIAHKGSSTISCRMPPPPPALVAAAETDIDLLKGQVVVVTTAGGQSSDGPATIAYTGSGAAITSVPSLVRAWRPVGVPGSIIVRWAFPQEDENDEVEPVTNFDIELARVWEEAGSVGNASAPVAEQTLSPTTAAALVRGVAATSDGYRILHVEDLVFSELPVQVRVRARNAARLGPWSSAVRPVAARCSSGEFLPTHLPVEAWTCLPCPPGAFCGGSGAGNVTAMPGYWRVPWSTGGLGFRACGQPDACLGYETAPFVSTAPAAANSTSRRLQTVDAAASGGEGGGSSDLNRFEAVGLVAPRPVVPAAVLGRPQRMEGCSEGYSGIACATCQPGYTRWGSYGCRKCTSGALVLAAMLGVGLLLVVIVGWLVLSALHSANEEKSVSTAVIKVVFSHIQTAAIAASFDLQWPDSVLSLFATMTSATSVSSEVLSLDCVLPRSDSVFFTKAAIILAMPLLLIGLAGLVWACHAAACKAEDQLSGPSVVAPSPTPDRQFQQQHKPLGGSDDGSSLSPPASGSGAMVTNPLAAATGTATLPATSAPPAKLPLMKRLRNRFRLSAEALGVHLSVWDRFVTSTVVILFLVHMSVTQTSLQLLTCTDVAADYTPDPLLLEHPGHSVQSQAGPLATSQLDSCSAADTHRRLVADLDVCCRDPGARGYMFGFGLPGMFLYAFGIPIGGAFVLFRSRNRLHRHHTKVRLGFLYAGFRLEAYYWEAVVMLRKVLVAVIGVFLQPLGAALQTYMALVLIFGLTALHAWVQPYQRRELNELELGALVTAFLTFEFGLFLTAEDTSRTVAVGATVGIMLVNIGFLAAAALIVAADRFDWRCCRGTGRMRSRRKSLALALDRQKRQRESGSPALGRMA